MRRAWAYGCLCLTTAACAGLLGIEDVGYSSAGGVSEAGPPDGDAVDAPGDSSGDGGPCNADLTRDPQHCGSCAHSCGTGRSCTDGLCAPELVVSGITSPFGVQRVAGATYVGGSDGVFRCQTIGCTDAGEALLRADVAANELVTSFSADDAGMTVAVLTIPGMGPPPALGSPAGRVVDCPLGPCTSPGVLASSEPNLQTVARSDVDVLWGRDAIIYEDLMSCPGPSCDGGAVKVGHSSSSPTTVSAIAPTGASILWMCGPQIYETTRDGGTTLVAMTSSATGEPTPLLRDGPHAFWGNGATRIVEHCDLAAGCSGSRSVLSTLPGPARALALDASFVYMAVDLPATDAGRNGLVGRLPRSGGTPIETLAQVNHGLRALTVDATHVYWAQDDGTVWRIAK